MCLSCEPVLGVYLVWLVRIDSSSSGLNWIVQTRTGSDFSNCFWKWNQNWNKNFKNKIRPEANWELTVNPLQVTQNQTGTRSDSQK